MEGRIRKRFAGVEVDDVRALTAAGTEIPRWLPRAPFPPVLAEAIAAAYGLDGMRGTGRRGVLLGDGRGPTREILDHALGVGKTVT